MRYFMELEKNGRWHSQAIATATTNAKRRTEVRITKKLREKLKILWSKILGDATQAKHMPVLFLIECGAERSERSIAGNWGSR